MVDEVKDFDKEVMKSDKPVVVDFWAPWCGPCKMLAPTFEKVAGEMKGKMKFLKANVDDNQDLAQQNSVRGIPCLVIYKNGEELDRIVGVVNESQLKKKLEDAL